mgnify:CR=1 FL=1
MFEKVQPQNSKKHLSSIPFCMMSSVRLSTLSSLEGRFPSEALVEIEVQEPLGMCGVFPMEEHVRDGVMVVTGTEASRRL